MHCSMYLPNCQCPGWKDPAIRALLLEQTSLAYNGAGNHGMYAEDLKDLYEENGFKAHIFSAWEDPQFERIMGPYSIFQRQVQVR